MSALLLTLLLAAPLEAVAATVNGEAIPLAEVDAALASFPQPLSERARRQFREEELQSLIETRLLKQYVEKHGPPSDPDEAAKQIAILRESMKRRGRDLDEQFKKLGRSEAWYKDHIDINNRFRKLLETKTTTAQYKAYFEQHKDHFSGASVTVTKLRWHVSAKAPEGEWAAAEATVAELRKDIVAGRITFADAGKRPGLRGVSEGPLTRRDPREDEALLKEAFALKVGEISAPVRTPGGVHLLTVTARTPGTATTFEKELDAVKDEYAADAQANLIAELRKKAVIVVSLPK